MLEMDFRFRFRIDAKGCALKPLLPLRPSPPSPPPNLLPSPPLQPPSKVFLVPFIHNAPPYVAPKGAFTVVSPAFGPSPLEDFIMWCRQETDDVLGPKISKATVSKATVSKATENIVKPLFKVKSKEKSKTKPRTPLPPFSSSSQIDDASASSSSSSQIDDAPAASPSSSSASIPFYNASTVPLSRSFSSSSSEPSDPIHTSDNRELFFKAVLQILSSTRNKQITFETLSKAVLTLTRKRFCESDLLMVLGVCDIGYTAEYVECKFPMVIPSQISVYGYQLLLKEKQGVHKPLKHPYQDTTKPLIVLKPSFDLPSSSASSTASADATTSLTQTELELIDHQLQTDPNVVSLLRMGIDPKLIDDVKYSNYEDMKEFTLRQKQKPVNDKKLEGKQLLALVQTVSMLKDSRRSILQISYEELLQKLHRSCNPALALVLTIPMLKTLVQQLVHIAPKFVTVEPNRLVFHMVTVYRAEAAFLAIKEFYI